jgi:hypothetical protein
MGCGCKNNNANTNTASQAQTNTRVVQNKQQQTESVKQAIKKTVEKYYNVNKSSK